MHRPTWRCVARVLDMRPDRRTTSCSAMPYAVLPFGNEVATRDVTGEQLWEVLERSVSAMPAANGRFAQIAGFKFAYTASVAVGSRVLGRTRRWNANSSAIRT